MELCSLSSNQASRSDYQDTLRLEQRLLFRSCFFIGKKAKEGRTSNRNPKSPRRADFLLLPPHLFIFSECWDECDSAVTHEKTRRQAVQASHSPSAYEELCGCQIQIDAKPFVSDNQGLLSPAGTDMVSSGCDQEDVLSCQTSRTCTCVDLVPCLENLTSLPILSPSSNETIQKTSLQFMWSSVPIKNKHWSISSGSADPRTKVLSY